MRARMKRRERRRKTLYITVIVVVAFVAIIGVYAATLFSQENPLIGKPVAPKDFQALYAIASSSSYGPTNTALTGSSYVKAGTGSTWYVGSKPIVVYIGADYCPNCAFMRWPLTVALLRFGNFSGLTYMQSSSTDAYPNTNTFSFYGSTYTSRYLVFEHIEHEGRTQGTYLQPIPSNLSGIFSNYGSAYPFVDVANKYILPGSPYYPDQLGNGPKGNWTLDILSIQSGSSTLYTQVMSAANAITALICQATGDTPTNVCNNPSVTAYNGTITALGAYVSSSASFTAGTTSSTAAMWSNVQYRQMVWRAKTSA